MLLRQLPAAISRSAPLSSNCTSFSASAKVEGETGGPASGAVPKAGGAPGGTVSEADAGLRRHAVSSAVNAAEAPPRNRRREFDMYFSEPHCSGRWT
jgi:hypothetical protein